jgi:Zn-dependent peptidase ImmA (M78 family)
MLRVDVKPELLRWACERAGLDARTAARTFPKLGAWERGEERPTLKQLEHFAGVTHAPVGFLFLDAPPVEKIPIPDLRTVGDRGVARPSPDLLETLFLCQQRQEWFRDAARTAGEERLPFVGSLRVGSDVVAAGATMRRTLGFEIAERRAMPTWTDALRRFLQQADDAGVLVMVNGVVGNNNRRKLRPSEFRGFALSDPLAPLVFINGADSKAAQMFTLAHELAHVWSGQSALSDQGPLMSTDNDVEKWCNQVAAEFLVPAVDLARELRADNAVQAEAQRLARIFKVSTLVILRRMHDAGALTRRALTAAFEAELARIAANATEPGGNFYLTQAVRVGKRFARTLIASTLEGQTLHRDALRLLGISKMSTFRELGSSLGIG